jgi:predicted Zn-dependent peptidase
MFEGSENIKRGEYFKYVQNAGGQLNAFTSFDKTVYYEVLPSNQLELGLWLESERMLHLKIDSVGVETQRGVVKEERKQSYENRPYGSVMEEIFKRAYKEHPYRWVPIGSAQYIDQAKLEEFIEFHNTFYVPNNAALCISGDINIDEAKELVKKYFGDIPRGKKEIYRPKIIEPPLGGEVRDVVYDNIQLPAVIIAYRIPAQGTPEYYALNVASTILSGGESSRLYKEIVDRKKIALQVGAFPFSLEDPGIYMVFSIASMGKTPEELENAIDEEIEKFKNEPISDKELEKAMNQIEKDFAEQTSSNLSIAMALTNYYLFFGDANLINTEFERYKKITKEDVQKAAKNFLNKDNRVILYYLPKAKKQG